MMNDNKKFIAIVSLIAIAFFLPVSNNSGDVYIPDVHNHGISTRLSINSSWVDPYDFKMEKTTLPEKHIDEIVENHDRSWQAYVMCVPQENPKHGCLSRIFVKNTQGDVYEIPNTVIHPLRVFDDVRWATNDILVFDQWTYLGFHTAIDIQHQKLLQFIVLAPPDMLDESNPTEIP